MRFQLMIGVAICLTHILSFLPTKLSVKSSVLAKRWRYLWAYVPTLDFDREDEEFIGRVISLRKVESLNTLRLTSNGYNFFDRERHPETWVASAIDCNVQNLHLSFFHNSMFPRCLLTCKTLVDLRIYSSYMFPIDAGVVFWPRLKILHLRSPKSYHDCKFLDHLHSICPVLEELLISRCSGSSSNISSPTLKSLTLDLMYTVSNGGNPNSVVINAPALVSGPLNSLSDAEIYLEKSMEREYYFDDDDFLDSRYSRSVLEFLDRLCLVKCLKLDLTDFTEIIGSILSTWTISFHNLTKLELAADSRILLKFLENADNLEILQFKKSWVETEGWTVPPAQVPTCLLSRLTTIKLGPVRGERDEVEFIRYMLMNARVLEMMEITIAEFLSSEEKIYILQQISMFERESRACKVAFDSFGNKRWEDVCL